MRRVDRFVTPEEFAAYETIARSKGFLMVSSSPLTRSSHHAGEDFERLARRPREGRRRLANSGTKKTTLMHRHQVQRPALHPDQLFQLVGGVETYPTSCPGSPMCASRTPSRSTRPPTGGRFRGRVRGSHSSQGAVLDPGDARPPRTGEIGVRLISGPSNTWSTTGASRRTHPQCRVKFQRSSSPSSHGCLDTAAGRQFRPGGQQNDVACFEARARTLYSPVTTS